VSVLICIHCLQCVYVGAMCAQTVMLTLERSSANALLSKVKAELDDLFLMTWILAVDIYE